MAVQALRRLIPQQLIDIHHINIQLHTASIMDHTREFSGKIKCNQTDLNLKITLTGGQSFRWKQNHENSTNEEWIGVMCGCLWMLSQNEAQLIYRVIVNEDSLVKNQSNSNQYYETLLREYFQLDVNLEECYEKWRMAHDHFKQSATNFLAIRVLNQEPLENLLSFICSQNNHINRISSMVEKLCTDYGKKICCYQDSNYYAFPKLDELNLPQLEQDLRSAKFGYRAAYISKAVSFIIGKGGEDWLNTLKGLPYKEARSQLIAVPGIGPKVADCICLMSLGHLNAVPVDTHIYKVAGLHYLPHLRKTKTVTSKAYEEVGDSFRKVYGPLAGWAQTVIFCADLERFSKNNMKKEI